jgi:hypothetical protein
MGLGPFKLKQKSRPLLSAAFFVFVVYAKTANLTFEKAV